MRTKIHNLIVAIGITAAALALMAVGWVAERASEPHCPTEDSCMIDYHDGAWHITPDVP